MNPDVDSLILWDEDLRLMMTTAGSLERLAGVHMQASWHAATDSKSSGRLRTLVAYYIKRIDNFPKPSFQI